MFIHVHIIQLYIALLNKTHTTNKTQTSNNTTVIIIVMKHYTVQCLLVIFHFLSNPTLAVYPPYTALCHSSYALYLGLQIENYSFCKNKHNAYRTSSSVYIDKTLIGLDMLRPGFFYLLNMLDVYVQNMKGGRIKIHKVQQDFGCMNLTSYYTNTIHEPH